MASMKTDLFYQEKPQAKKARTDGYVFVLPEKPEVSQRVALNPADCDLDFNIDNVGHFGSALYEQGFGYCWSGARANVGITRGKYCFGCTVISEQPVDMEDTAPEQQHVCRLGISRGDIIVGKLGESEHSFGYGGTGKFSHGGKFSDYGQKFGIGDTLVCCIDLEKKPFASIGFSKNGEWLGTATQFDAGPLGLGVVGSPLKDLPWESAVFPHVLLKNVVVQMQFSVEDGLVPQEGFKPWASAIEDQNFILGPTCYDRRDCELIMMVGLPGSGKTTWAEKWVKVHPEKRYVLLGTNLILDQMKVPGLLRKNNYGERFDQLMDRATGIFNILIARAANTPRNYIIDQTNVYKGARKHKLKPFTDFRKIAVVTFPKTEELKRRSEKRFKELGKEIPPDVVKTMLANFVLPKSKYMPGSDEFLDEVMYVELNRDECCKSLEQLKQDITYLSNNNSSMLSHESYYQSSAGPPLPNQGSFLTGSGCHPQDSYSPIRPCNYRIPIQGNVARQETELGSLTAFSGVHSSNQNQHLSRAASPLIDIYIQGKVASRETGLQGSLTSFSGPHSSNQNQHLPGAASTYGTYSNDQPNFIPRDSADYCGTYGAIPRGNVRPYSEVDGSYSGAYVEGNNNIYTQGNVASRETGLQASLTSFSGVHPSNQNQHLPGAASPLIDIYTQGNVASRETGLQGSLTSFSGAQPSNLNQHLPGAISPYGTCSNDQPSFIPRDSAGYCGTYGAIPRGNVGPYSEVNGSYSGAYVEGNNNIYTQGNVAIRETGLQGSLTSFSGVHPTNQNQHLPGAASPYGTYSNDQPSFIPRYSAGYCGTYGAIPSGNIGPYSEVDGSYSGAYVEGNNNVLPDTFPDPYRSGLTHPSQVANTRTAPFFNGVPNRDIGGPQSNLLTSRT